MLLSSYILKVYCFAVSTWYQEHKKNPTVGCNYFSLCTLRLPCLYLRKQISVTTQVSRCIAVQRFYHKKTIKRLFRYLECFPSIIICKTFEFLDNLSNIFTLPNFYIKLTSKLLKHLHGYIL